MNKKLIILEDATQIISIDYDVDKILRTRLAKKNLETFYAMLEEAFEDEDEKK